MDGNSRAKTNMKTIPLSQGKFALVDDADFDFLNQWKWSATKNHKAFYAHRNDRLPHKRVQVKMHRVIMCAPPGQIIDHIDGDGLNNQRSNLRFCTKAENNRNQSPTGLTSKYRGVFFDKRDGVFRSSVRVDGKRKWLGSFLTDIGAARAYNAAAIQYYGEFARLNEV